MKGRTLEEIKVQEIKTTKQLILDRALFLIGKKGTTDVSVREIAKEAGVNIAAINYHFQSKDRMFEQMEEFFISNFNDAYKVLYNKELDAKQRIIIWANKVMEYTLRYPGIIVIIKDKINYNDPNKMGKYLLESTKENYEMFNYTLKSYLNIEDGELFEFCKMIIISSLVHPVSNYIEKSEFRKKFLEDYELRMKYVNYLVETLRNSNFN